MRYHLAAVATLWGLGAGVYYVHLSHPYCAMLLFGAASWGLFCGVVREIKRVFDARYLKIDDAERIMTKAVRDG